MHTITTTFLVTFGALFPIVNPLEAAPLFHVMTRELAPARQNVLARRVAVNGLGTTLNNTFTGVNTQLR